MVCNEACVGRVRVQELPIPRPLTHSKSLAGVERQLADVGADRLFEEEVEHGVL